MNKNVKMTTDLTNRQNREIRFFFQALCQGFAFMTELVSLFYFSFQFSKNGFSVPPPLLGSRSTCSTDSSSSCSTRRIGHYVLSLAILHCFNNATTLKRSNQVKTRENVLAQKNQMKQPPDIRNPLLLFT
ncbi:hypothetical protein L596_012524 [Steinernema carpocapsae]|uniref:Uncharacterized protein n=1 Tax=Steinernema carpocapsae TaxID=34508 RepID=A0A4U5NXX3_STECR|nr:hypothetical protein L596_012524 [Steinernema carpocapsae]